MADWMEFGYIMSFDFFAAVMSKSRYEKWKVNQQAMFYLQFYVLFYAILSHNLATEALPIRS